MDGILQVVNVPNAVAVGGVSAGLYYLFIDNESSSFIQVGLATGIASMVSDWLASMAKVQSVLASLLKSMLKPFLVGATAIAMSLGTGSLSFDDIEALAYTFGFAFVSKYIGDYLGDMYRYRKASKNTDVAKQDYM